MKKIEFKAKYKNSIIIIDSRNISSPILLEQYELLIINVSKELGLEFLIGSTLNPFEKYLRLAEFEEKRYTANSTHPEEFSFEEFKGDWNSVVEAEEKEKYKDLDQLLEDHSIKTTSLEEKKTTPTEARNAEFIQSITNEKISLWWNSNGRRLVFICGRGCFELSKIE